MATNRTTAVAVNSRPRIRQEVQVESFAAALSDLGDSTERMLFANSKLGLSLSRDGPSQLTEGASGAKTEPSKGKWKTSSSDEEAPLPPPSRGGAKGDKSNRDGSDSDSDSDSDGSDDEEDGCSEGVDVFPIEGGGKYRDYSRAKLRSDPVASIFAAASSKDPTFPVKLHQILSTGEFEDIIAWLPHGRAFRVLQPKAFEERVIPLFFRHGRYASFARQVNGWGFHRITNGPDYGSYYHELFLRGLPYLCERMRRPQPGGPRRSRKEISAEPSPNLYEISEKAPLPELPSREPLGTLAPPGIHGGAELAGGAAAAIGSSGARVDIDSSAAAAQRFAADLNSSAAQRFAADINSSAAAAQRFAADINSSAAQRFAINSTVGQRFAADLNPSAAQRFAADLNPSAAQRFAADINSSQRFGVASPAAFAGMGMGPSIYGLGTGFSHRNLPAGAEMFRGTVGSSAGLLGGRSAAPSSLFLQGAGGARASLPSMTSPQLQGLGGAGGFVPGLYGMGGIMGQSNLLGATGLFPGQQSDGGGNFQGTGSRQYQDPDAPAPWPGMLGDFR